MVCWTISRPPDTDPGTSTARKVFSPRTRSSVDTFYLFIFSGERKSFETKCAISQEKTAVVIIILFIFEPKCIFLFTWKTTVTVKAWA